MSYNAFVSYNRQADGQLAPKLRSALHSLASPWYWPRALRIFLDTAALPAVPGLSSALKDKLADSEHFVLLASPNAAQSDWVRQEVQWWLDHKGLDKFVLVLTDGHIVWDKSAGDFDWSRTTALPAVLRGRYAEEPGYVKLDWARGKEKLSLDEPEFRRAVLDIAAPLHGKDKDLLDGEDVRQHRWRIRLAGGAIVLLLILLVAAVTYWWRAKTQGERAENQKNLAWGVLNRLNHDIPDRLRVRPGTLQLLRETFEKNAADLDRFLTLEGESPSARTEVAVSRLGMGDMWKELGSLPLAEDNYRKAVADLQPLVKKDLHDVKAQLLLARSQDMLGDVSRAREDLGAALAAYQKALRIREIASARDPDNKELLKEVSYSHNRVGGVLAANGQRDAALAAFQKGLALRQKLARRDPDNLQWQFDLGHNYVFIGRVLAEKGEPVGAMDAYQQALSILEPLSEKDPTNTQVQKTVESVLERVGDLHRQQGDWDQALEVFRTRLTAAERVAKLEAPGKPESAQWQLDLLVAYADVAWVLREQAKLDQGKLDEALRMYEESRRIAQKLVETDPTNVQWKNHLAVAWNTLGDVYVNKQVPEKALAAYQQGFDISQRLAEDHPENLELKLQLAKGHANLGIGLRQTRQFEPALTHYEQARAIVGELIKASPDWVDARRVFLSVEEFIAELQQAKQRDPRASSPGRTRKPPKPKAAAT